MVYYKRHPFLKDYLVDLVKTPEVPDPLKEYGIIGLIEKARPLLFNFDYPMWSDEENTEEKNKEIFETKFLKYFFPRELCYFNYDMWSYELNNILNLIMPYYSELLESETWYRKYVPNPAANTDWTESFTRTIENENERTATGTATSSSTNEQTGETTSNSTSTGETTATASAGNLMNELPKTKYDDGTDYATAQSTNTSSSTTNASSTDTGSSTSSLDSTSSANSTSNETTNDTGSTKEIYESHKVGNIGVQTPGEVFASTRLAFINATQDILNDPLVQQLFMEVF